MITSFIAVANDISDSYTYFVCFATILCVMNSYCFSHVSQLPTGVIMSRHISIIRNISRFSTLGATTSPSQTQDTEHRVVTDKSLQFPDFTILPADTSCLPPNSPYYLYNPDPNTMTKNYMKKIGRIREKNDLRQLSKKLKKESLSTPSPQTTEQQIEPDINQEIEQQEELASTISDSRPVKCSKWKTSLIDAVALPHSIAFDLSYSHLMTPFEMKSTAIQMIRSLKLNVTDHRPLQLHITNYHGCIRDHVLNLKKKMRPEQTHLSPFHYTEVFPRNKVVYLSAESDNILERVEPSLVYIIGGLVDARKDIKGASLQAAIDAGVRHARLPIKDLIITNMSRPLTINRVYQILHNFIRTNSWLHSLTETLHPNNISAVRVTLPLGTHSNFTSTESQI